MAEDELTKSAVDGFFGFKDQHEGVESCSNGDMHVILKGGEQYGSKTSTADRVCPALIERIHEEEGIEGLLKGFQGADPVGDVLAKAYMTKDITTTPFEFDINGKKFAAPEEERAVLAGAIFGAKHLGTTRLADSTKELIEGFFIRHFGGKPEITGLQLPKVTDAKEQLARCFQPGQTENKLACAIAGEELILRNLKLIAESEPVVTPPSSTLTKLSSTPDGSKPTRAALTPGG